MSLTVQSKIDLFVVNRSPIKYKEAYMYYPPSRKFKIGTNQFCTGITDTVALFTGDVSPGPVQEME